MQNTTKFEAYIHAHLKAGNLWEEADSLKKRVESCEEQLKDAVIPFFTLTPVSQEEFSVEFRANPIPYSFSKMPFAIVNILSGIYHLALGIFSQMHRNIAKREFQEAHGRLIVPFNLEKGAYLIQQAQFHKSSYDYFSGLGPRDNFPYSRDLKKTTLKMVLKDPEFYIKKFEISSLNAAFVERLKKLPEVLLNISVDAAFYKYYSNHYLITDEEFASLTLEELKHSSSDTIADRYWVYKDVDLKETDKTTLNKILKGQVDVNILLSELPKSLYFLIPNTQIKEIKFETLHDYQISELLKKRSDSVIAEIVNKIPHDSLINISNRNYNNYYAYLDKSSLQKLSKDQIQEILGFLGKEQLSYIPVDILKLLDISKINASFLEHLFSDPVKAQCLTPSQIESVHYFKETYAHHFSIDQVKALDFMKSQYGRIKAILSNPNKEKVKEIVQSLSNLQIKAIVNIYFKEISPYLTDLQIKSLPIDELESGAFFEIFTDRNLPELARRIELFGPDLAVKVINKMSTGFYAISDEFLLKLDFSKIEYAKVKDLLGINRDSKIKPRISLISDVQFESILINLKYGDFSHLTIEQLVKYFDRFSADQKKSISLYCNVILSKATFENIEPLLNKLSNFSFLTPEQFVKIDFKRLIPAAIESITRHKDFLTLVNRQQLEDCVAKNALSYIRSYELVNHKDRLGLTDIDIKRILSL